MRRRFASVSGLHERDVVDEEAATRGLRENGHGDAFSGRALHLGVDLCVGHAVEEVCGAVARRFAAPGRTLDTDFGPTITIGKTFTR